MSVRVPRRGLRRVLRDPLLHFALAGAVVFLVHAWVAPASGNDERVIQVDDDVLVRHLQYNDKAFAEAARGRYARMLTSMPPTERDSLVAAYVREEALHREALALGLDRSDYVIRRRLVQTMEYLLESTAAESAVATAETAKLSEYFERNKARYRVPSMATFTHVFFARDAGGMDAARARARSTLARIARSTAALESVPTFGDRFPYFVNYVDATRDLVTSHLGAEIAAHVFDTPEVPVGWVGPLESPHGVHLVMLTGRVDRSEPRLDDVLPAVQADYRRDRIEARREALIGATVATYAVRAGRE